MRAFKKRLKNITSTLCGSWIASESSYNSEIMSRAGFDALFIDCEHTALQFSDIFHHVQAASIRDDIGIFVRVPMIDKSYIKKVLDIGITGIVFPNVETKENLVIVIQII